MSTKFPIILLMTIVTVHLSCERSQKPKERDTYKETVSCSISDGSYSARVFYENPSTDYSSIYTLDVEIINNELTVLHFPNSEYLDEDHISSQYQDTNCSIHVVDDRGRNFTIQVFN